MADFEGTSGHDQIVGTADDDTINGLSGRDYLSGLAGNDLINGGHGPDIILGGSGIDTLNGGHGNDVIYGGSGNDIINGGHGADIIFGGSGADILTGGNGSDTFSYTKIQESTSNPKQRDTITDFNQAQQDKIDLHLITGLSFIGDHKFDGQAGELNFHVNGNNTFVSADVNGDGKADFQIKLKGAYDLSAGDFIL